MRSGLAAILLAISTALAVSTSAAGATPVCHASQLRGQLRNSSGAAGTIVLSIQLTNKGPACTLKGYARLQLMASARRPLETHTANGGLAILNQKPKLVRLAHGGAATFFVAYSDVPRGYAIRCPMGTEILVRIPGDQTWIPVLAETHACGDGILRESPFLAGRRHAP